MCSDSMPCDSCLVMHTLSVMARESRPVTDACACQDFPCLQHCQSRMPASQNWLQLQGSMPPTCAAGTDACICSSIHCVGQHLLHEECIIGDNGCRQVGMHLLCDLQDCVHLAVIILCQNLQVESHFIDTALLAVDSMLPCIWNRCDQIWSIRHR